MMPDRVVERLLARRVAHERHVDHEECAPQTARHATAVIDDVIDRDGHRRVETLDHHAEAVADEHHVGAGEVDELRETRVVRRQARDRLARLPHIAQRADVDWRRLHAALLELLVHGDLRPSAQVSCAPAGLKKWRPCLTRKIVCSSS